MENPVTYKGSLEWLWGGEGGVSSLESMTCLCLPHLGWPCQTKTPMWYWAFTYMRRGTLGFHTETFSSTTINSFAEVLAM